MKLSHRRQFWRLSVLLVIALLSWSGHACRSDEETEKKPALEVMTPLPPTPPRQLFKGKVVRTADALKRRGVKVYADDLKNQVALETPAGELLPILPDWRGRAFHQDERLRERDVELVGFRREGLPYLNILSVYTFDEKRVRHYTDYWCDICSIPMYEIKPCDCCQQEIRLRFQPQDVTELNTPSADRPSK
ncbi:MAG: hypothetical protein WCJ09_17885 [Planctomycetota bacterium]